MPNEVRAHAVLDTGAATTMVPVWRCGTWGWSLTKGQRQGWLALQDGPRPIAQGGPGAVLRRRMDRAGIGQRTVARHGVVSTPQTQPAVPAWAGRIFLTSFTWCSTRQGGIHGCAGSAASGAEQDCGHTRSLSWASFPDHAAAAPPRQGRTAGRVDGVRVAHAGGGQSGGRHGRHPAAWTG